MKCSLKRIKGKKADLTDSLAFVVTVSVLAIGFFILAWTIPAITNGLNQANLNNTAEGANAINQLNQFGVTGIDNGFLWLFIGLCIAELISAFFLQTHPIWLFLWIIFLGLSLIIAAYLGNTYELAISNAAFAGFHQTYMTMIMQNIVKFSLINGAVSIIIIFSRWAVGGGGGTPI